MAGARKTELEFRPIIMMKPEGKLMQKILMERLENWRKTGYKKADLVNIEIMLDSLYVSKNKEITITLSRGE